MKNKPTNIFIPDIGKYLLLDGFIVDLDPEDYGDINQRINNIINMGFKQIDKYKFISVPFTIVSITRIIKSINRNLISHSFPKMYNKDNFLASESYYYNNPNFENAILLTDEELKEIKKNKVKFLQKEGYL